MKLAGMILVAGMMLLFASVSFATPIDPGIGLGGTGSSGSFTQTQCQLILASCTLMLDSTGSGIADITNDTGFNIISDTIIVDTAFGGTLFCNPENPFGLTDTTGSTATSCTFSEPLLLEPTGILNVYGIHFQNFCMDAACTMPLSSLTFDLSWTNGTTPVPEPGTMLLLGTGLAGLLARRKWHTGVRSND